MEYKYNIGQQVQVNSIIQAKAKVTDRLQKDINLYQVEILEDKYKGKQLWFSEPELSRN